MNALFQMLSWQQLKEINFSNKFPIQIELSKSKLLFDIIYQTHRHEIWASSYNPSSGMCRLCLTKSFWSCLPRQQPHWTRGTRSTTPAGSGRASCLTRLEEMLIVFSLLVRKLGCPITLSTGYLCLIILGATPYGTVCCWNTHNLTWKCVISVSWH